MMRSRVSDVTRGRERGIRPGERGFRPADRGPAPRLPGIALFAAVCGLSFAVACQESLPTAETDDLVRAGVAVQVTLGVDEFLDRVHVYGGYGRTSELGGGFIAHRFGGGANDSDGVNPDGLEAVTLLRFGRYPEVVTVNDTTGTSRPDSALTFRTGRVIARFDTIGSVHSGPVEIGVHALTEPWDGRSANWEYAIDTLQHRVSWTAPGGGLVEPMGTVTWDPGEADSVVIPIDSLRVMEWGDSANHARGIRLDTQAEGVRLQLRSASMWIETMPSLNPDTLIDVLAGTDDITFLYSPLPGPPDDGMRVGGAPAWRTVLDLDVPASLDGPPSLCADVGCPVQVTDERLSYAALLLTTRPAHPAFAPSDTISMDLRMVMVPSVLPKSPLGPSLTVFGGVPLAPEWFSPPAGDVVEIPVTELVRDLLRGETTDGDPVSGSVALLSAFEPLSIEYATFAGLDGAVDDPSAAPRLRMILNFARGGS